MADRNRRSAVAATALTLLFVMMSGLARAATFTVSTTNDTGMGSLRDAITSANAAPTVPNTINFSVSGTIMLGSTLPAIANTSPGSLKIDGSGQSITVDGASAVQILSVGSGATLNLLNLTFAHGSAAQVGGAIANSGTLNISDCTFANNQASDSLAPLAFGGAIFTFADTTMTITDSTFSGNQAIASRMTGSTAEGGAIYVDARATLTITNSTLSSNKVSSPLGDVTVGGAIVANGSTVKITNCTFSNNQALGGDVNVGGALRNSAGTLSAKGTILAGGASAGNCSGSITDNGYNLSDDDSCGFSGTSQNSVTNINLDAAGLANNGGSTDTIALEPNSKAVDFIPIASCTDQSSPTPVLLTADQRGLPRPDPGNPFFCDAGAYELQTSGSFILNSEKIQVAHNTTTSNADQVNMGLTFTDTPNPTCDAADDVLHHGITVELFGGSCSDLMGSGLTLDLDPFVVHTISGHSYGTIYQSDPPNTLQQSGETVSARIVPLTTPGGDCGKFTLNLEVGGLDNAALGLVSNPFALRLIDSDMRGFGCFDITNAIVGTQLDPTRKIRRGGRR